MENYHNVHITLRGDLSEDNYTLPYTFRRDLLSAKIIHHHIGAVCGNHYEKVIMAPKNSKNSQEGETSKNESRIRIRE